jgi:hypothetical protein
MKSALLIVAGVLFAWSAFSQEEYQAQVRVRVVDEAGVPVARARVVLSTYTAWIPGRKDAGRDEYNTEMGLTDGSGSVAITLKGSSGRYSYMALPLPEFHWDRGKEYVFTNYAAGRWEPWSPTVTITLKRKVSEYTPEAAAVSGVTKAQPDVSKDPLVAGPPNPVVPARP